MNAFLIYIFIAYLLLSLQAIFFKGVKPDFVLVIVCYYSLKFGRTKGVAYGALTGLIIDTVNGFLLGPHIIGKSIAGYFVRTLRDNLYEWNIVNNTFAILIFSFANILVVYLCLEVFLDVPLAKRSLWIPFLEIVYTVIASLVMYPLFKPFEEMQGV